MTNIESCYQGLRLVYRQLAEIEKHLSAIAPKEGCDFREPDNTTWVFVGQKQANGKTCGWFRLNGDDTEVLLPNLLSCRIIQLKTRVTEYKEKESLKLNIHAAGVSGKTCIIQSGWETQFSRQLMYSLYLLNEAVKEPIDIQVQPAKDDDKIVFCKVYWQNSPVEIPPVNGLDIDWEQVMDSVNQRLA